ncbi:Uncharacterized protein BM_BM13223 [Brugia malayi]|uniref:Bm13223, isoform b n=1 Tax=Brugia malayi TaxID=6279 RepID=A0A0H5BS24_BRUMA|nr:Uncharacterized protein BM_BM13223 [Brugia malayi]CDQ02488.1 Bm13223, isoform b [Brugia malayi]CDQ08535.1 Bm14317 [Brugia malayi]VIO96506.1 Uncharacterized protein BM_BM13223 [Brugia malayi]
MHKMFVGEDHQELSYASDNARWLFISLQSIIKFIMSLTVRRFPLLTCVHVNS